MGIYASERTMVTDPIDLSIHRLNEVIESLPPFSETRKQLVEERLALRDSITRLSRVLGTIVRTRS